jgi:hypothetical protein
MVIVTQDQAFIDGVAFACVEVCATCQAHLRDLLIRFQLARAEQTRHLLQDEGVFPASS